VVAKIVLTPNADEPYERTISGIANCSVMNSTPDFFVHAEALASNRASNRAWREYLNINSVSFEEINPLEKAPEVANIPQLATVLLAKLKDHGKTEADIPKIIGGMFELGSWDGSISSMDPEEILATLPLVK
jgi:hypothetical protein